MKRSWSKTGHVLLISRRVLYLIMAFLAALTPAADAQILKTNAPSSHGMVGFIWHYPFSEEGVDQLAASGANVLMARCNWGVVQPDEETFDFTTIGRQIQVAEQAKVKLVLLLEFNPFCAPAWLKEKCKAAGEGTCDVDGRPGSMPRTSSILFRQAQEKLVRQLADYLRVHDLLGTVTHYMPGIEWWFPPSEQHSPADIAMFREWLQNRYGTVEKLNTAWGGSHPTFDAVNPPGVDYGELFARDRQGLAPVSFRYLSPDTPPALPVAVANDWNDYWNETGADYINSLGRLVEEIDPGRPRASYLTFAWAQAAEWDYLDWSRVRLDSALAASSDLDIIGMQLCFTAGDSYRLTAGFDMARKYGKPMWDMDLLDFVEGVKGGFDSHERNTHAAIQHGASSLFYCCWNGAKDFNFHPDWPIERINRMTMDARKALELVRGATVVVDGAVVNPIVTSAPGDPSFGRNDVRSLIGWYKIAERLPKTFDIVTPREMENRWADLAKYRWLLIPDCPYISDMALERLREYERGGGVMIRGGRFAEYTENGIPHERSAPLGEVLPDLGRQYAGQDLPRRVNAGDTPPQMIWRPETDDNRETLAAGLGALRDAFQKRGVSESVTVSSEGKDVRSSIFKGDGYELVYLVNWEPSPTKDIRLAFADKNRRVKEVYVDLETISITPTDQVVLPTFRTSCIVRVDTR